MAQRKLGGSMRYEDLGPHAATAGHLPGGTVIAPSASRSARLTVADWEEVAERSRSRQDARIARAVVEAGGNVASAAASLGLSRSRIYQVLEASRN